jgi:hypothetical protein
MEVDRTLPTRQDETRKDQDWIEKYRAAMDGNPVPRSRLSRMRGAVAGARRALFAGMKRIFGAAPVFDVRNKNEKNAEPAEIAEISNRKAVRRESGRQKSGKRRSVRAKKAS